MRVFRVFSYLGCVLLFVVFSQGVSAQCFVQVNKYCGDEQFSNPCSELCVVNGASCGFSVAGDPNLVYSDVYYGEGLGQLDVGYYPNPRYCGKVKFCKCKTDPLLPAVCSQSNDDYSDYWVTESYADGGFCVS